MELVWGPVSHTCSPTQRSAPAWPEVPGRSWDHSIGNNWAANSERSIMICHTPPFRYSMGYMKASNGEWKSRLAGQMPPHLATELDIFENEIILKKQAKIEDRIFTHTLLRPAAYRHRHDTAQLPDGR